MGNYGMVKGEILALYEIMYVNIQTCSEKGG